jgi:flagellar motility protein MotE (MotC chaperone)
MKKVLSLGLTALVLFGLSAAASWILRGHTTAGESSPSADATTAEPLELPGKSYGGSGAAPGRGEAAQRVAVKAPYSPGAEEAIQLANTLRDRLTATKERETQLAARQKHLELIYHDIRSERAALDEIRKQVSEELKATKEAAGTVERRNSDLEEQRQKVSGRVKEMEDRLIKVEDLENGNVQKMAEVVNTMAPESAAKILQQLADSGKMETAVKLLGLMKERQAAKVLAELPEPALAAQLLEKLKDLKRPTPPVKK